MPAKNIATTLKELRKKANLTQKQAYEHIGVAQSTFSSWETGKAEPSTEVLLRLCQLYKVDDILGAFGYDGYNEDGSLQLNINEIDIIEKYRHLDAHGRKMVDFTLKEEYNRIMSSEEFKPAHEPDYLMPVAAHERTDIEVTDEMRKFDDDIMDDENF